LTDEQDKVNFDNLLSDLMIAETDVVYWKDKYYGTWPSDTVEVILRHIERLQARIKELQNENQ
jgi:hypothetical protein